jgi:mannose-6-phosphate isomerase-like protein (cupin superfamily)
MDHVAGRFSYKAVGDKPDVIAADGSEVRVLCQLPRGAVATFTLPPGAVSKAVAHRTVEEVWCVIRGQGRTWRKMDNQEQTTDLMPGISVAIPTGMHFQFRNDGTEPLEIVAATMPPWPGEGEAYFVEGKWDPTV